MEDPQELATFEASKVCFRPAIQISPRQLQGVQKAGVSLRSGCTCRPAGCIAPSLAACRVSALLQPLQRAAVWPIESQKMSGHYATRSLPSWGASGISLLVVLKQRCFHKSGSRKGATETTQHFCITVHGQAARRLSDRQCEALGNGWR